jgi:hypothetical protein
MGLPPVSGLDQTIWTLIELIAVVGAKGVSGTEAHKILICDVSELRPFTFLD